MNTDEHGYIWKYQIKGRRKSGPLLGIDHK